MSTLEFHDSLYGEVRFPSPIRHLALTPAVQRLRQIRLSNIDSLSLPGFAGATRYEHALGSAAVAGKLGFLGKLQRDMRLAVQAAALLHDTAITPFGHLVEEAFGYVGRSFDHETKWQQLVDEQRSAQPGGADAQVYLGRESGLRSWAEKAFGRGRWSDMLGIVVAAVRGQGEYGHIIAGQLDVDNMDNVTRAAFHMGVQCDRSLPWRLAKAIRGVENGLLVIDEADLGLIVDWLTLRRAVYGKLMLAEMDYSGKAMVLAAATAACERRLINENSWRMTDAEFTRVLLSSSYDDVKDPLERWLLGDLWTLTDVVWMAGMVPSLADMYRFSQRMSAKYGRCVAYRIVDKRSRKVEVQLTSGDRTEIGDSVHRWLFGAALAERRASNRTKRRVVEAAADTFESDVVGYGMEDVDLGADLFD